MHHISKATALITLPARTAFAVASAGLRTTVRLAGWAAEQATGQTATRPAPVAVVPDPRPAEPEVRVPDPMEPTREAPVEVVAPLKKAAAKKAPAKKVPASQVPLKSDPTPSMPAGVRAIDDAFDDGELAPRRPAAKKATQKATQKATKKAAKKTPATKAAATKAAAPPAPATKAAAKKAPATKAPAKKAPSKQAAVLAPALGLSEDEVATVVEKDADRA